MTAMTQQTPPINVPLLQQLLRAYVAGNVAECERISRELRDAGQSTDITGLELDDFDQALDEQAPQQP